jgi:peptide/nickel transport system substrate-binding protein
MQRRVNVRNRGIGKGLPFLAAAAAVLFLAACGPREEPPPPPNGDENREGGELVIALGWEPDPVIDPYRLGWGNLPLDLFEGLLCSGWDFIPGPGIAESWSFEEDGRVQVYKIRQDRFFHDGRKIDAESVKRYFELLLDPDVDSTSIWDFAFIREMEVVDEYTLKFILDQPFPAALYNFSWGGGWGGLQSPYAWEEYGPWGEDIYGTQVVAGTGPFKFAAWIPGEKLVLERFDGYRSPPIFENRGPAYLDRVTYRFITDPFTRLLEFEAGRVHILESVPLEYAAQVRNRKDAVLHEEDGWEVVYLGMACDREPFQDVRVRKALNLAINQEELAREVWLGLAEPAYGYLSPKFGSAYQGDRETFGFDPARAKELLAEAGYPDGFTVNLAVENRSDWLAAAEAVRAMLQEVGVTAVVKSYERGGFYDLLRSGRQEMFLRSHSWYGLDILPWYFHSINYPYPNYHRYSNPEMDRRFDEADSASTFEEMIARYLDIQKDLATEAVWVPLVHPKELTAVRKEVKGLKIHVMYGIRYNVDTWLQR